MPRYFLEISFAGGRYHGWQKQLNAVSVQNVIEEKIHQVTGQSFITTGCGRTDTGVHARQFFLHADFPEPEMARGILKSLNSVLPPDIVLRNVFQVPPDASARFDAISRTYEYSLVLEKNPFLFPFSLYYPWKLDFSIMNKACLLLQKHEDFKCFEKSGGQTGHSLCSIKEAQWVPTDFCGNGNGWMFKIRANRFLRNMVRAIVGTLIEVGRHQMTLDEFTALLNSGDRSGAGTSVDANGLNLVEVNYPPGFLSPL